MLILLDFLVTSAVVAQSLALHNVGLHTAPARGEIVAVTYGRESWRDDGRNDCAFKGYMTGFDRTWEVVQNRNTDSEITLPPAPGVTEGQAVIFTEKVCKDKPTVRMFQVGEHAWLKDKKLLPDGKAIPTYALYEMKVEDRPLWLEQVIKKVEARAQSGDPVALKLQTEMLEYAEAYHAAKEAADAANNKAGESANPDPVPTADVSAT